jgi:hypothetical protein
MVRGRQFMAFRDLRNSTLSSSMDLADSARGALRMKNSTACVNVAFNGFNRCEHAMVSARRLIGKTNASQPSL